MEELRLNGSLCFGWSLNTNFNQFWFHQKDVYSEEIPYIIRLFSPKTGSYKKFLYTYTKWYSNGLFSTDFNGNKIIGPALSFKEDGGEDRLYVLLNE